MGYGKAIVIGSAQILALLAGISRDGVTMVAGMARGLSREDAARFAFLLSTPVILAAGVLKIPDRSGRWATASAARSCSAACCPASAPTSRFGSSSATCGPGR
jgi:undecaprenyl pyrophosphate phosphatase UppP